MNRIEINYLPVFDTICDYIPIVSTITNLVELFFKCFILPYWSPKDIQNNYFHTYLHEKSFSRCILLLIPILGNIIIGILDCQKGCESSEGDLLQLTSLDGDDKLLKDAENFLTEKVQEKGVVDLIMAYAGHRMSEEEKAWLARVSEDGFALRDASAEIRRNFEIVKAAIQSNAIAIVFADDALKDDEEIIQEAMKNRPTYPYTLFQASPRLRGDAEFVKAAIQKYGQSLYSASEALQDNEDLVRLAIDNNPYDIRYASARLQQLLRR